MKLKEAVLGADGTLTVIFVPENVKEAELLGGAAGALAVEAAPQAAMDIEALAVALGFTLPKVG